MSTKKNCYNCGHAYPNINNIEGPCLFFGEEGEEDWESCNVCETGCRFWLPRFVDESCECRNWARSNILLLTKHHPNCPSYNVEEEAKAHIEALLMGIIAWANDEDGVHDECFDAFRSAALFIGKPDLVSFNPRPRMGGDS